MFGRQFKNDHSQTQKPARTWELPPRNSKPTKRPIDAAWLTRKDELAGILAGYKVKGKVIDAVAGPIVTRFEFQMEAGGRIAQLEKLAIDIGRSMGTSAARITLIEGKSTIGIELPNPHRAPIEFSDLAAGSKPDAALPLLLGKNIDGTDAVEDLAKFPHLLVAGTTGSGKSVGLNAILTSLLMFKTPKEVQLILVDPKMVELAAYGGLPHLLSPIIHDAEGAMKALDWAIDKMEKRYKILLKAKVKNIDQFNAKEQTYKMPRIVIAIDEYADIISESKKEFEGKIQRIAQKARAAGIHLILTTQRPSVDVVTGIIKANVPARICFKTVSKFDSQTVLGMIGAETLLGRGDMIFQSTDAAPRRIHGSFIADPEIDAVVRFWTAQRNPDGENENMEKLDIRPRDEDDTEKKPKKKSIWQFLKEEFAD